MREIKTETYIHASPEAVWETLAEFGRYPEWNPFIRRVEGEPQVGRRLEVEIHPPGGRMMTFRPRVLKAERNRELRWLGHLWRPGIFDGEHVFCIEALGTGRLRFVHRERFTGLLAPFLVPLLERSTRHGFAAMNEALKVRAEAGVGALLQAA